MSVNGDSDASRQFVASATIYSPVWEKMTSKRSMIVVQIVFWALVLLVVLRMVLPMQGISFFPQISFRAIAVGFMVGLAALSVAVGAYFLWRWRLKFQVTVTADGLTIGGRRGAYSLDEAQLGIWVDSGVALHLRSGRRRFLLGGRDRRVGPSTPLDAPPVQLVDAWLAEAEFNRLLSLSGRWGRAAREPAPGEPTRCLLFPNPLLIQEMGSFAFGKKQRLIQSLSEVQLFVDVDDDAIRVIDPQSNAVKATASLSQVTGTPATYQLPADDGAGQYFSTMPALTICVAGAEPLTIGCRDFRGLERRFSWRAGVPVCNDPPTYAVSAADWRTLVEGLGLAARLDDNTGTGG